MSAGGNRSAWPSRDDFTFASLLVIVLGGAFLFWQAWVNFHTEISGFVASLAHWQIVLIQHFKPVLHDVDGMVLHADPRSVTFPQIAAVLNATGIYLRLPAVLLIGVLALACLLGSVDSRFTRNLDLDSLIVEQARTFRVVAAYAVRFLKLEPLLPGKVRPADPALHTGEWVARYALDEGKRFDEARARRRLVAQLGPRWAGPETAASHVRLLFIAFALHLQQDREQAKDLLGALSEAIPPGNRKDGAGPETAYQLPAGLVAQADALLRNKEAFGRAREVASAHAFTATALMSLLTEARRRSGVLAPAQFACLKLVDRDLWYALHSLGFEGDGPGQTSHPNARVEAAGARDHWAAERIAKRPLPLPAIEQALDAVRTDAVQAATST